MDTSMIDASRVTLENGLKIGSEHAPVKIIEFMNVRCPYSKKWFETYDMLFTEYVAENKIQRIIKLFDKEKESLQRGNVMHQYINYDTPEKSLADLRKMYATQEQWGALSLKEVATFATTILDLTRQTNPEITQAVIDEANAATIHFVPTIIIGDQIFDESITEAELKKQLN